MTKWNENIQGRQRSLNKAQKEWTSKFGDEEGIRVKRGEAAEGPEGKN